jgi:hypothetical protein
MTWGHTELSAERGEQEMPNYLLAYHGSAVPKRNIDQSELARSWNKWMDELGDVLEGSNNPMIVTRTVNPDGSVRDGGGANPVAGLSFIKADDIDAAVELAKTCPHLAAGGSIEVAELA